MEAEVWHYAQSVMTKNVAKKLNYALNGKTVEDEGMICGGTVKLFIEPVTKKYKEVYQKIIECLTDGERAILMTRAEGLPFQKTLITETGNIKGDHPVFVPGKEEFEQFFRTSSPSIRDGFLIESVIPSPHLNIYGAGHISQHISTGQRPSIFR